MTHRNQPNPLESSWIRWFQHLCFLNIPLTLEGISIELAKQLVLLRFSLTPPPHPKKKKKKNLIRMPMRSNGSLFAFTQETMSQSK